MPDGSGEVTRDTLLGGRVSLLQPLRGHRAGTDAVLLAAMARPGEADHAVDLGAATGAVGLMLAARHPGIRLTLVERDPALVALGRRNIAENGLGDRVDMVEANLFGPLAAVRRALPPSGADLVVTNPPFFAAGAGQASPEPGRRDAHVMREGDLGGWLLAARRLLRPRGRLLLIHRADALADVLAALAAGFGSVAVTPVAARRGEAAIRIVVAAVKGGRAALVLYPPLSLYDEDGRVSAEAVALDLGLDRGSQGGAKPAPAGA